MDCLYLKKYSELLETFDIVEFPSLGYWVSMPIPYPYLLVM